MFDKCSPIKLDLKNFLNNSDPNQIYFTLPASICVGTYLEVSVRY